MCDNIVMDKPKHYILWSDVAGATDNIVESINKANTNNLPIHLTAIARGGLIPATIIAHKLGIKNIEVLGCPKTQMDQYDREINRMADSAYSIDSESRKFIVIVDDIIDQGTTVVGVLLDLGSRCHKRFNSPCPVAGQMCVAPIVFKPTSIVSEQMVTIAQGMTYDEDGWVVFPWETRQSTLR